MDDVKAKRIETELKGKDFSGYQIEQLLNYGKSAAVFHAKKLDRSYALKIFDQELIEAYGSEVQESRIKRELELIGHEHPNLVKLYDGGFNDEYECHYIIMEYIQGKNLEQIVSSISSVEIESYIEQIAKGAKFLEEKKLVHRDIKPANIMLKHDKQTIVLMDFGVIRPVAGSGLTDGDKLKPFVGTLQYSSPEFLLREEEDTVEGWRALTFYQIGAVLHDLIMHRPIFSEYQTPYARLVNAVQKINPEIRNDKVSNRLITLAKCCLLKNPRSRIEMISWNDFFVNESLVPLDAQDLLREKIKLRRLKNISYESKNESELNYDSLKKEFKYNTFDFLKECIRSIRNDNSDLELPLCTIIKTESDSIIASFEKSDFLGIQNKIDIEFFVDIVDVKEKAIKIWLTTKSKGYPDINLDVFSSIYDGDALYTILKESLYNIFNEFIEA